MSFGGHSRIRTYDFPSGGCCRVSLAPVGINRRDLKMAITEVPIRYQCLAELLEGYMERPLVALPILTERRIQHIRGVGERFELFPTTAARALLSCREPTLDCVLQVEIHRHPFMANVVVRIELGLWGSFRLGCSALAAEFRGR